MPTIKKLILPYDVYERHRKVASLISEQDSVLDVGGAIGHLALFCNAKKIVTANLSTGEKSDVIISKGKLPFKDQSFDVVCSIDVLEHIPQKDRKGFIEELKRVALKKVILSFPIGTKKHNEHELEMIDWLQKRGEDVTYLKEHVKHNLPTLNEIKSLTSGDSIKTDFSGNIPVNRILFKLFMFDPKIKYVRKFVYYFKNLFNVITNPFFYPDLMDKNYSQSVNRAYLTITK